MQNKTNNIYLWVSPERYPFSREGIYNKKISPGRLLFFNCKKVTEELPKIVFNFKCPSKFIENLGAIPNDSASPLVREDVLEILDDLIGDEIQIFDTEIHTKDGMLNNYKLINILNEVPGVNLDESICKYMTDEVTINGFKFLTLKENCLGKFNLARLEEQSSYILVSEALKERFEKNKIKGAWMVRPEVWYGLIYNFEEVFKSVGRIWDPKKYGLE